MRRACHPRLLFVVAGLAALGGCWGCATRPTGREFVARAGAVAQVESALVASSPITATYDLNLRSSSGLEARARLRVPHQPGRYPGVLLTVGLGTGKRVIDLLDERSDLVVMAVDYEWDETFDASSARRLWRMIRRVRATSRTVVPSLLLAAEALRERPNVDPDQITIVGVSYGAYFALAAAALDEQIGHVIAVQGGGSLAPSIAASAAYWEAPAPPRLLGWLGSQIFSAYRPERWAPRVSPRRLTFIASRRDPMLPATAIESVFRRAGEPKTLIWQDTTHVHPEATAIIAELSAVALELILRPTPPAPAP